jgi:hypothetical protein
MGVNVESAIISEFTIEIFHFFPYGNLFSPEKFFFPFYHHLISKYLHIIISFFFIKFLIIFFLLKLIVVN